MMFGILNKLRATLARHEDYCVRCRQVQKIHSVKYADVNGRNHAQRVRKGRCAECGARTSAFVIA